tara:strand:+ start:496 stop:888 length:393 start_codon:yes stop_codon:yes gene_type:complete
LVKDVSTGEPTSQDDPNAAVGIVNQHLTLCPLLTLYALGVGISGFRNHWGIFNGVLKLTNVFATLAYAFAGRTIGHGNYPIVGTMRVYVLGELVLVNRGWNDTTRHPTFGSSERYVYSEGKVAYCKPVHG